MKKLIFIISSIVFIFPNLVAQQDAENCKDHPMFNRMKNFLITECTENFAALELVTGQETRVNLEGTRTHIYYSINTEGQPKQPSWLQIVRNYENAIFKIGGKKIYTGNDYGTYSIINNEKEIYVMLTMNSGSELSVEGFMLDVLEKEAMKQEIAASDIYSALNSTGSIALYINFETGKSTIMAGSQKIIGELAEMLKSNPALKVRIDGHTDNVGTAGSNLTLSENRAKAVMNALIAKGIDKTRLSVKGFGQEKPLMDNGTDEGKAKNRRVEIVKI